MEWDSEAIVDPRTILFKRIHLYLVLLVWHLTVLAIQFILIIIYINIIIFIIIIIIYPFYYSYSILYLYSFYSFAPQTEARRVEILAVGKSSIVDEPKGRLD